MTRDTLENFADLIPGEHLHLIAFVNDYSLLEEVHFLTEYLESCVDHPDCQANKEQSKPQQDKLRRSLHVKPENATPPKKSTYRQKEDCRNNRPAHSSCVDFDEHSKPL